MLQSLTNSVKKWEKDSKSLDHLETYIAMSIITVFAAIPHLLFWGFFLWYKVPILAWVNAASLLVYAVAFLLLQRHVRYVSSFIITFEVLCYAALVTFLLGEESGCHWFALVVILPHYLFSDVSPRQRVFLTLFVLAAINAMLILGQQMAPIYAFEQMPLLQVIHLNIVVLSIVIELMMSSVSRLLTRRLHEHRLRSAKEETFVDPLTGMRNRRYVDECFHVWLNEVAHGHAALVMIDLDEFKHINDDYGHPQGDKILEAFAEGARTQFRHSDLLVRWGGDEFLLGLHTPSAEQAYHLVEKLRRYLDQNPVQLTADDPGQVISFSAGISAYDPQLGLAGSIALCDQRLYESKRHGRNNTTWQ